MPSVTYRRTVSDANVRTIIQRIADTLGQNISVHSGDRNYVPTGGSNRSLHMQRRAADFHVTSLTDAAAFDLIRQNMETIFDHGEAYEVIHHGVHTATGGPHLHIGRYGNGRMGYVDFKVEGLTPAKKGVYDRTRVFLPRPSR